MNNLTVENRGSVEDGGVDRGVNRVDGVNGVDGVNRVNRGDRVDGVDRSRVRGRVVFGFSRVLHISDVSTVSVIHTVSHSLDTTIGQSHVVFTRSSVSIAVLSLTELGSTVVIGNGVIVGVDGGCDLGVRGGADSQSHSDEGSESQNDLKI